MEILPNRRGKPILILHGQAAARAAALGLTDFSVSLTHSRTDAMAFVVAVKAPTATESPAAVGIGGIVTHDGRDA
jgi:holo-[acyl-carrier protein] synthase